MTRLLVITYVLVFFLSACKPVENTMSNEGRVGDIGWINIELGNKQRQSFITTAKIIKTVEVNIRPSRKCDDTLTLNLLSENNDILVTVLKDIPAGFYGWALFEIPNSGLNTNPGTKMIIQLEDSGALCFGWRYSMAKYPYGEAIFFGDSIQREYDFYFRINYSIK